VRGVCIKLLRAVFNRVSERSELVDIDQRCRHSIAKIHHLVPDQKVGDPIFFGIIGAGTSDNRDVGEGVVFWTIRAHINMKTSFMQERDVGATDTCGWFLLVLLLLLP
jgi:hypothetical protein